MASRGLTTPICSVIAVDPVTYAGGVALLVAVSAVAFLVPASRPRASIRR
ncbi:MAG TPA: hypothetical protein VII52_03805 [Gemmatimonadaceae bacterium]